MSTRKLLTTAALVTLMIGAAAPSFAEAAKTQTNTPAASSSGLVDAQYEENLRQAGSMLGEIGTARLLLDLGVVPDAQNHIQRAEKIAAELEQNAPEIIAHDTFKLGKSTYKYNGDIKDYMIPVIDDVLTVKDFEVLVRSKKNANVDEVDNSMVRYKMSMNIKDVHKFLLDAQEKVAKSDKEGTLRALDDIYRGAFIEEAAYDNPYLAVNDNLVLAHNQITRKNYGEARFALNHAVLGLKNIEKSGEGTPNVRDAKRMSEEITALQNELKIDDPTVFEKAEQKVQNWMKEVRGWMETRRS